MYYFCSVHNMCVKMHFVNQLLIIRFGFRKSLSVISVSGCQSQSWSSNCEIIDKITSFYIYTTLD